MAVRKRSEIDERYQWKVEHIYPSDEAWQEALKPLGDCCVVIRRGLEGG